MSHEYEHPISTPPAAATENLQDIVLSHKDALPILVTLSKYASIPGEFHPHLYPTMDLVVHSIDYIDKVVAVLDRTVTIVIDRNIDAMCQTVPRTFKKIAELQTCIGCSVMVTENVTSKSQKMSSLKFGDTLRVNSFEVQKMKVRNGIRLFSECKYITCEKTSPNGTESEEVRLPLNMEVTMLEKLRPEEARYHIRHVFKNEITLPVDIIIYEAEEDSRLPLNCPIRLTTKVWEPVAMVSPLTPKEMSNGNMRKFDPNIEICLEIPLRHDISVYFRRILEFPGGYFRMPEESTYVCMFTEEVNDKNKKMLVENSAEYECLATQLPKSRSTVSRASFAKKLKAVRAVGKSITSTLTRSKGKAAKQLCQEMARAEQGRRSSCNDEHIYETVETKPTKDTKTGTINSRLSGLFRFIPHRKKRDTSNNDEDDEEEEQFDNA